MILMITIIATELCITVILLLTNGNPVDSPSQITQTILEGNQLIGGSQVAIISFSMNSGE